MARVFENNRRTASPRARRAAFLLLLLLLAVFAWPAPAQDTPRFKVSSSLVLVDVRVRDSSGLPVGGLKAEDFTLIEEGLVQPIEFFQEVSLPLTTRKAPLKAADPPEAPTEPGVPGPEPARLEASDRRLLILLFNLSGASLQEERLMLEAGRTFVQEQVTPEDAVAVLTFDSGLRMLADLTSDRALLSRVMERLIQPDPELDPALPAEEGDPGGAGEFLPDETELSLFNTNHQLAAIQSVAEAFRDLVGRKSLIYFSSGLSSSGIENDEQMRLTADLCNRANVSVYAADARGLVALSPGGGAHRDGGRGTGVFTGRSGLDQLSDLSRSQEGLITLAAETGGAALVDENDFSGIFQKAREDASHYYLLGYSAATPPRDGRFRRIEVRTRIDYGRILFRRGYYAERPYRSLSGAEREARLLQAVVEEEPRSDFPLEMSVESVPVRGGLYQVPVLLAFDPLEVSRLSGEGPLNLEVVLLAREGSGSRAGVRDQLEIRGRSGSETRFVYQNLLVLDPGEYRISAYVRDNRTGLLSGGSVRLGLPAAGPIRSGSLILAAGWKEPDGRTDYRVRTGKETVMATNPLEVAGRVLIPRVNSIFLPGEALLLHTVVLTEAASGGTPGAYRLTLRNASREPVFQTDWRPLIRGEEEGEYPINLRLPLSGLEPGEYGITIDTRVGGHTETRTKHFRISG